MALIESQQSYWRALRRMFVYFALAILFFALSFCTVFLVLHFSGERFHVPDAFLSPQVLISLGVLLIFYFATDGLRLYCVIRALGFQIDFCHIIKLVFLNIFVSSVTPLATGGGVVQVYFMKKEGMPVGEATAATSIRTILAALILFALTPVIIWIDPGRFNMFIHKNIIYGITLISCFYLGISWIILFRLQKIRRLLFRCLDLVLMTGVISRKKRRRIFLKISKEMNHFSNGFKRYFRGNPSWAILSVLCTAIFLLLLFSFSIVLVKALGYQISPVTIVAYQVVVTFFMYFTPTPGATGVAEGGYGLLFSQIVQRHDIAPLVVSWRFLTIYIGVVIGIAVMAWEMGRGRKWRGV